MRAAPPRPVAMVTGRRIPRCPGRAGALAPPRGSRGRAQAPRAALGPVNWGYPWGPQQWDLPCNPPDYSPPPCTPGWEQSPQQWAAALYPESPTPPDRSPLPHTPGWERSHRGHGVGVEHLRATNKPLLYPWARA